MKITLFTISLLASSSLMANTALKLASSQGLISKPQALKCIQLNKDNDLATQQLLKTNQDQDFLKSKINYLQSEIQKRRTLIESLDNNHNQINNKNYNQLINAFERLMDERKHSITEHKTQHQRHQVQNKSVNRLAQRFLNQCTGQIKISKQLYSDVCADEKSRWCNLLEF